jgi:hypothetical protein
VVIRAVARILGLTPAQLRTQLARGRTLSEVALAHGLTLRRLRRAVEARLHQQVAQLLG